jgi:hypothetical protein
MISTTLIFMTLTWVAMLGAFFLHRLRSVHIAILGAVIVIDVCFPFYLFLTRDWQKRLFEDGEILSFLLWMHLLLVITLYVLYVLQVQAGRRILRGDDEVRGEHRGQGIAILVTRALVIMSGGLLFEPLPPDEDS